MKCHFNLRKNMFNKTSLCIFSLKQIIVFKKVYLEISNINIYLVVVLSFIYRRMLSRIIFSKQKLFKYVWNNEKIWSYWWSTSICENLHQCRGDLCYKSVSSLKNWRLVATKNCPIFFKGVTINLSFNNVYGYMKYINVE